MALDKASLSEHDIRTKFITPALARAGWDIQTQLREEFPFTAGQILVRGKAVQRGAPKRVDYLLYYRPNIPLAVIEAKDNNHAVGAGMQQALAYAEETALALPFVFSSNGDGFLFHDKTGTGPAVETELALDAFPSPDELWQRYRTWKGITLEAEALVTQPYYVDPSDGRPPRYYQLNAINRTIEAIARGRDRILLVMATGIGKTFTAFQIIWRLWKAGQAKRVLFLADRNILVDQTKSNDFKPFGQALTKIKDREADQAYEVYLALYQAITGPDESKKTFREFAPTFFDLIVIDECHRGSAAEDSQWREILEYFSAATQIGLTATPKETKYVSNIDYFGEPVYSYSLRQGIQDGFLAPYQVVRIDFDRDLAGYRPEAGKRDRYGVEIEDRIYDQRDFDRELILDRRTRAVARKITAFLKGTDRLSKTIVFCEDIDHAERMRQALVNENADLTAANRKYVMRITGDNAEGKAELASFIDPETPYPVLVTTSRLLTTGVDAQTVRLIALDRTIGSMTEFKQIIGRGTRVREDYGKQFFTIMDFRRATENFADPAFDGPPICTYEPKDDESPVPGEDMPTADDPAGEEGDNQRGDMDDGAGDPGDPLRPTAGRRRKYYVGDVTVSIVAERVQYFDPTTGKLITESLKTYTRKRVQAQFATLDEFLTRWSDADRKTAIVDELERKGILWDALAGDVGADYDPFDLILHVAYDRPPMTRAEPPDGPTGEELLKFVNGTLFPALKALNVPGNRQAAVVRSAFGDAFNFMKSGTLLRQVINKLNEDFDLNRSADRHQFGEIYEQLLRDLQAAGNAGEFYTPRAVTKFMVDRLDPKLGESILDPAAGTGGFLTGAIDHVRGKSVKTAADEATLQRSIRGYEKKQLPHLLCVTNLMLHGLAVPDQVRHDNTLSRPLTSWGPAEKVDVVLTNPPFGGVEEDLIEHNFDPFRTRETADLFLVLIMRLLRDGGRAALVLPDGTLFGEGIKTRIKEKLLAECDLHTIVRLPNGVFAPYTSIKTNLLFFTKGKPTEAVWYYEHPYPAGQKTYNKTNPIRFEEFAPEQAWLGPPGGERAGLAGAGRADRCGGLQPRLEEPPHGRRRAGRPGRAVGRVRPPHGRSRGHAGGAGRRAGRGAGGPTMNAATFLARFGDLADAPGGVAKLRELVLELAVRGRLVPPRPK